MSARKRSKAPHPTTGDAATTIEALNGELAAARAAREAEQAAAEAATGQRVSEAQAAALLLAGGYMLWRFVLRPSGAGAGRGGGERHSQDAALAPL